MQKANKGKGKVVTNAVSGNLTNKAKNSKAASTLPFAHRTPTQLHASTYALKRS